jgi:hypothetical protein
MALPWEHDKHNKGSETLGFAPSLLNAGLATGYTGHDLLANTDVSPVNG